MIYYKTQRCVFQHFFFTLRHCKKREKRLFWSTILVCFSSVRDYVVMRLRTWIQGCPYEWLWSRDWRYLLIVTIVEVIERLDTDTVLIHGIILWTRTLTDFKVWELLNMFSFFFASINVLINIIEWIFPVSKRHNALWIKGSQIQVKRLIVKKFKKLYKSMEHLLAISCCQPPQTALEFSQKASYV